MLAAAAEEIKEEQKNSLGNKKNSYLGLGAAPKSNLLYGIGDGSVFTVELFTDGTAAIVSQLAFAGFTGAGDITSAPGNLVYAVSGSGKNAYQVNVDANFYPISVSAAVATTGSVRRFLKFF